MVCHGLPWFAMVCQGLIDFLIHFGLRKQAEHLLRAAQGHGADTSCVDPADYAARQVRTRGSGQFGPAISIHFISIVGDK